jgi:hypothetical protein
MKVSDLTRRELTAAMVGLNEEFEYDFRGTVGFILSRLVRNFEDRALEPGEVVERVEAAYISLFDKDPEDLTWPESWPDCIF